MKHLNAFIVLTLLFCTALSAQNLTSKAVATSYDRQELFKICKKSIAQVALPEWNIDQKEMCNCLTDSILLSLLPSDLEYVTAFSDKPQRFLTILLLTHYAEFEHCCGIEDRSQPNPIDFLMEATIQHCVNDFCSEDELKFSCEKQAYLFCECAANMMRSGNYTYEEIFNFIDEDGTVYNEVLTECEKEVYPTPSSYSPCDIIGDSTFTAVKLSYLNGKPRKVKISIEGVTRYFLLDTGADGFIINREIEALLLENGSIKKSDYTRTTNVTIADGSTVKANKVMLQNVRIGDYIVNNIEATVINDGSPLCGHAMLNKFKSWKLEDGVLYLYK